MFHLAHTSLLSLGLVAGLASVASAAPQYKEFLVHDTTSSVEIDLNSSTVLCSAADYSGTFLKIGMPELAGITLLDHQNIGANAPCVAAGPCEPGNMPEDIIDPTKPTETVAINVKAIRSDSWDTATGECTTALVERVNLTVRGVEFTHERWADLGSRLATDCGVGTPAPNPWFPDDDKADGPGTAGDESDAGGCSAAGSGGLASGLLLGLAALVGPRRRRAR